MILRRHLTWRPHLFLPVTVSPPHAPPSGVQSAKFCKAIASSAVLHSAYQYWPIASIVYVMLASVLSCHCRNLCHDAQGLCTVALNNPTTNHPLNTHYIRSTNMLLLLPPTPTQPSYNPLQIYSNWKPWHFDFCLDWNVLLLWRNGAVWWRDERREKKRNNQRRLGGREGGLEGAKLGDRGCNSRKVNSAMSKGRHPRRGVWSQVAHTLFPATHRCVTKGGQSGWRKKAGFTGRQRHCCSCSGSLHPGVWTMFDADVHCRGRPDNKLLSSEHVRQKSMSEDVALSWTRQKKAAFT